MSEFIHEIRREYEHEDARANEEYRAPMRDVYYRNGDGEQCKAPIVAEDEAEAIETLTELLPEDGTDPSQISEVEVVPSDQTVEQLKEANSTLHSHLLRSADRRKHEVLWHAFDTAPEHEVGDGVQYKGEETEVVGIDFDGEQWKLGLRHGEDDVVAADPAEVTSA